MDVPTIALGAALGQLVRKTIDVSVVEPIARRFSSDATKAKLVQEARRQLEERSEVITARLAEDLADAFDASIGRPDIMKELGSLIEAPEMITIVRQAIVIRLGLPDRDLALALVGPIGVTIRANAPLISSTVPNAAKRLAGCIADATAETIAWLGLPREVIEPQDLQNELAVLANLQLAAISRWMESAAEAMPVAGDWRLFPEMYRSAVKQLHSKLPTPHWDGEPRVNSDEIYVDPRFLMYDDQRSGRALSPLHTSTQDNDRIVLLGDPGNGKTSYGSRLVYMLASKRLTWGGADRVPFVVTLRAYQRRASQAHDGMSFVEFMEAESATIFQLRPPTGVIEYLLHSGRAFVVFDGLDEILNVTDRSAIVNQIELFAARFVNAPVLATSRRNGYATAPLDSDVFRRIELDVFKPPEDVDNYVAKWFSLDKDSPPGKRSEDRRNLMASLAMLDEKLYTNPLTLALLCNLFKAGGYQPLPKSRTEIYQKCSLTLYSRWDQKRGLELVDFDRIFLPIIAHLANEVVGDTRFEEGFTERQMTTKVVDYLFPARYSDRDDALRIAQSLVDHCTGRAWVFSSSSQNAEGDTLFTFTHRTFLEYFAALHLSRKHATGADLAENLYTWIATDERAVICDMAFEIKSGSLEDAGSDFIEYVILRAEDDDPDARNNAISRLVDMLRWVPTSHPALELVISATVSMGPSSAEVLARVLGWQGENGRFAERHLLAYFETREGEGDLVADWGATLVRLGKLVQAEEPAHRWHDLLSRLGLIKGSSRPWWDSTTS